MRVVLTPEDLKDRPNFLPGWYPAEIVKYDEAVVKDRDDKPSDGSMNSIFFFKILDGVHKDREIRRYFNEKFMSAGKHLYAVLGFPKTKDGGYEVSSELFQQTVGHKLMIYIIKDKKTGYDSVEDYKPLAA